MLNEIYKQISINLSKLDIPYIIIGGQAALLYMEPRFTYDIDITLDIDIDDSSKLIKLCNELNWKILVENPIEFISETMVLPVISNQENIRIDFIFSNTYFEKEAIHNPNIIEIEGTDINFCSFENLIIFKIFSNRQKDLDDVYQMLKNKQNYNIKLIYKHLLELGSYIDKDLITQFNLIKNRVS